MDLQLSDKTALISGSHRGTGAVIARALSAEGASVILHSDIEGACDALAEELDADAVWGNLSSDEGCDLVLQQLHRIGEVDEGSESKEKLAKRRKLLQQQIAHAVP